MGKKDIIKAVTQLRKYPEGWVQIQQEPETFLTKTSDKSRENLFEYIRRGQWRLVDQVADGYFWMNSREEILLLTQKKFLKDYWSWTASRTIFNEAESVTLQETDNTVVFDLSLDSQKDC